jgi:hypothetical protein
VTVDLDDVLANQDVRGLVAEWAGLASRIAYAVEDAADSFGRLCDRLGKAAEDAAES